LTRPVRPSTVPGMKHEKPKLETRDVETYEKPEVVDYGDLAELTAGTNIQAGFDNLLNYTPQSPPLS